MFEILRRDQARYVELGGWWKNLGFWVGATYRLGSWAHGLRNPLLRIPILIVYRLLRIPWRLVLNVEIPAGARIGPGLCLIHPSNILVGAPVVIGEDCLIFHEVTLGTGPVPGCPVIGNRVDVYVGARVLGGITVGDGTMVGANCVVTRNVPPESVVVQATRIVPKAMFARSPEGGGPIPA
jgi:serine O-acetyltransferase